MELLKQAHARGLPPPKHRYEQRTFSVVKYGGGGGDAALAGRGERGAANAR